MSLIVVRRTIGNLTGSTAVDHFGRLFELPAHNWRQSSRDVLLSTIAAALSWWAATALLGDRSPVFAVIAAIVCLSPGVASHGRQAVGMLIGVGVGIAAGELARSMPLDPTLRIALVTPVAMLAAASFGLNAVMVIQAGGSAVLVVASSQSGIGFQRFADAGIGGSVGLLFSQVLFTPDPIALVESAGARLVHAVEGQQGAAAVRAAGAALEEALASARAIARRTLRGRLNADAITSAVERWRRPLECLLPLALLGGSRLNDEALREELVYAAGLAKEV